MDPLLAGFKPTPFWLPAQICPRHLIKSRTKYISSRSEVCNTRQLTMGVTKMCPKKSLLTVSLGNEIRKGVYKFKNRTLLQFGSNCYPLLQLGSTQYSIVWMSSSSILSKLKGMWCPFTIPWNSHVDSHALNTQRYSKDAISWLAGWFQESRRRCV